MAITFLEPGGEATLDASLWDSVSGAVSADTTFYRTGSSALKLDRTGSNVSAFVFKSAVLADAGRRIGFACCITDFPTAQASIVNAVSSGATNIVQVQLTTSGVLRLLNSSGVQVGSDGPVLTKNTWHLVTLAYTITSSTVNELRLYVDGAIAITVSNGTLGTIVTSRLTFSAPTGASRVMWIDDIYVDDSTALTDVGDVRIAVKRPASNNTNLFDTAIGANPANRWTNVNEQPLSTSNGWQCSAGVQTGTPTSDITVNSWTPSTGATLFDCIDEASVSVGDFITSSAGSTAACEVKLSAVSAPAVDTVTYRWNAWSTGSAAGEKGRADLYQGTTLKHTGANQSLSRGVAFNTTFTETLSSAERAAITDWTDLRIRFQATTVGATETISVSWASLTTPQSNDSENYGIEDASAGSANLAGATFIGHGAWVYASRSGSGSGETLWRNGTEVGITLTTSPAPYMSYAVSATYPSTLPTVGLRASQGAISTSLYECGMLIAYTPQPAPPLPDLMRSHQALLAM
jgi:hypothetical protein